MPIIGSMPPLPKEATLAQDFQDREAEIRKNAELNKFAPKKYQDPNAPDRDVVQRGIDAYDKLRVECDMLTAQINKMQADLNDRNNQLLALQLKVEEAKTEATSYRHEADEAKAETAGWRHFFANVKAVFDRHEIPTSAPAKKRAKKNGDPEPEPAPVQVTIGQVQGEVPPELRKEGDAD